MGIHHTDTTLTMSAIKEFRFLSGVDKDRQLQSSARCRTNHVHWHPDTIQHESPRPVVPLRRCSSFKEDMLRWGEDTEEDHGPYYHGFGPRRPSSDANSSVSQRPPLRRTQSYSRGLFRMFRPDSSDNLLSPTSVFQLQRWASKEGLKSVESKRGSWKIFGRSKTNSKSAQDQESRLSGREHSLASSELAGWTGREKNRRGSTVPLPFCVGLSPVEAANKAQILETVQAAIIKLFQRKTLKENELGTLQEYVRNLSDSEAGNLIYDYYKDQLLKKGMVILREKIKNEQGAELLEMLGDTWDYFFTEILPTLQALLYPLAIKHFDIRNTTLLEFRNIVVLKVSIKEALDAKECEVPANIRQMLLVLQGLRDDVFLSENQFRCEKLVARVVSPYLGQRGLYEGGPEPVARANYRPCPPLNLPTVIVTDDMKESPLFARLQSKLENRPLTSPSTLKKPSQESFSFGPQKLKPVLEHVFDVGRRHSLFS